MSISINDLRVNDNPHTKQIILIGLRAAKFLLKDVDVVLPSNNRNIVSKLIDRRTNFLYNSRTPFFKCLKVNSVQQSLGQRFGTSKMH